MRNFVLAFGLTIALSGCVGPSSGGRTLVDDTGAAVPVADLSRIVPTSVDIVEILLGLGHRDRLAAVPDWIDSQTSCVTPPPGIEGIPQIGRPHVISAEQVLAQRPTLVIEKDHPLQPTNLAAQLRNAGVPVFVIRSDETLGNVAHTYERIGDILADVDPEAPRKAAAARDAFSAAVEDVRAKVEAAQEPEYRALYQFPAGLVAARGTTGHLLLDLAGAADIAAGLGLEGYKQMAGESVASADPERVVVSCTAAGSAAGVYGAPKFEHTTAARLQPESLRIVDPSTTGLVGPRFPTGLRDVAQWLHPAAFGLVRGNATWDVSGHSLVVNASTLTVEAGPAKYRLDPGDGTAPTTGGTTEVRHTFADPGTYTVRFQVLDAAQRVHEERREIQVNA